MSHWPRLPVSAVCEIVKGGVDPQRYPAELFAHYSIPALDEGDGPAIEVGDAIKSQKTVIENKVVLVSKLNPRIPRVWLVDDDQACRRICSTEFVPLKPDPARLDLAYLAFAMRFALADGQISGSTSAATKSRERAKPNDLLRLTLPLPPLSEQRRIVDLLVRAEGIVRLRREAEKKAAELIPALFLDMFGDPATNPKGWPVQPFGELADNKDGRRKPVKAADRDTRRGSYPYYGASGIIDQIDDYLFDGEHLLIAEDGANLVSRSTPIAFIATGKFWVNNHAHIVSANGKANLVYLECLLNQRDLKDFITGSAQPKLTQANLNAMSVMVPSLDMQNDFSVRVEAMQSIQAQQSAATAKAQETFDALLGQVFS